LKLALKRAISSLPFGNKVFWVIRYCRDRHALRGFGDTQGLFTKYFVSNRWGDPESVSGPGSTRLYTENIRREIPRVVETLGIRRILDAPCGDYNWFRLMSLDGVSYVGGDIVEPLVRQNNSRYGNARTRFIHLDVRQDPLPDADLWLCRDCFLHLSERDIVLALDNFVRSGIAYLLTSTHPDCELNTDIPTGSARPVNLRLAPFALREPALVMDDWIEGFPRRLLALWRHDDIVAALAANKTWNELNRVRTGGRSPA
jgi:hypothetical protein